MISLPTSLFLLLLQAGLSAPSIEVRPSTSNVSVGEKFQVTLEAHGTSGTTYEFPKGLSTGAVELTPSRQGAAQAEVAVYDAQIFAVGDDAQIPEIEVQYKRPDGSTGAVKTAPLRLNVVSSLSPDEQNPTPADYAPPMPVLVSKAFWIASTLAGLLVLALIAWLVRRLVFPRRVKDPVVTPALTPEEQAINDLDRLAAVRASVNAKAFYIQLVQIMKQFLERRLGAPILEMTSTETLGFIKAHAWTAPHAVAIRELISAADLVKFSGSSDASNSDRQIQLVRDLVARVDRLRRAEIEMQAREQERRKSA